MSTTRSPARQFAEMLDFNMRYYMSLSPLAPTDDHDLSRHWFRTSEGEVCYAIKKLANHRWEFLFTCRPDPEGGVMKSSSRTSRAGSRLAQIDYSEEELPPSEFFVVHLTALGVLRESGVVPRLLDVVPNSDFDKRWIAFEYYGSHTLEDIRIRLSLLQIGTLASRMIAILEQVHAYGIVHGDVGNLRSWVVERWIHEMRISNFRRACLYLDPVTLEHVVDDDKHDPTDEGYSGLYISPEEMATIAGGDVVLSKASSLRSSVKRRSVLTGGITMGLVSRRDDLANLAELILNLLIGTSDLFADEYTARNSDMETVKIAKRHRSVYLKQLYGNRIPSVFLEFYDACIRLKFSETVNYTEWARRFRSVVAEVGSEFITFGNFASVFIEASESEVAAFKSLKGVDREDGQIFSLLMKQGDANDAALAVLKTKGFLIPPPSGGISLSELLSRDRAKIIGPRFGSILIRLVKVIRAVHESGIVHGQITADNFVWTGGATTGEYIGDFWTLKSFSFACTFITENGHIVEDTEGTCNPIADWDRASLYGLMSGKPEIRSRRDDAFQLMEMILDITFGSHAKSSSADALSYKLNRHRNCSNDYHGILSELYYRSTLYGFSERPDYEGAIMMLVKRIV